MAGTQIGTTAEWPNGIAGTMLLTEVMLVGSDLYTVAEVSSAADSIGVFKSTDGGSTWTEQDSGNRPTVALSGTRGLAAVLGADDDIHVGSVTVRSDIGGMDFGSRIEYHKFDPGTDTWTVTNETVETITTGDGDQSEKPFIDIAVHRTTPFDPVLIYNQTESKDMGQSYHGVRAATRTGTATYSFDNISSSLIDAFAGRIAEGTAGSMHIIWDDATNGNIDGATLKSGTPSSVVTIDTAPPAVMAVRLSKLRSWQSGSTWYIGWFYESTGGIGEFWRTEEDIDDHILGSANAIDRDVIDGSSAGGVYHTGLVVDHNGDLRVYWLSTSSAIMSDVSTDDGDTWGTDVQEDSGSGSIEWGLNAAHYNRSGEKVGIIYYESDEDPFFVELSLGAAPDPIDLTHFNGAATFFSPQLDGEILLTHFSSPAGFFSPTVADSSIDLTHFNGAATFFGPTLVVIEPILLDHFNGAATFFSPQLDGEVLLDHLNGAATFFAPDVVGNIDLDHFNGAATFFAPEFVGIINLDQLSSTVFFAITVEGIGIINLDLLDGSPTFPNITVAPGTEILDMDLLDGSATFHSPSLVGAIDLTHFNGAATFFSPQLDGEILLTHFNGAATFFGPTLDGEILLTFFDGSATFFAVEIVAAIDLDLLNGAATFFGPTLADSSIDLTHFNGAPTFPNITVVESGGAPLDMDLLDGSAVFNNPDVVGAIDLDHLSTSQFFQPQLDGEVVLDALTGTQFFQPTVGAASIDLEVLNNAGTFFGPDLVGAIDLLSDIPSPSFFGPTVGDSSIDLDLLFTTLFYSITVVEGGAPAPTGYQLPMRGVDR